MARLGTTFNAQDHDTTQSDFELLPTGVYRLEVSASDVREEEGDITLAVTYDVIEPEQYKGRRIFGYIDLQNKDSKKQEDGQRDFAKLCRAVGVGTVDDSEQLHLIAFTAKVQNAPAGVSKAGRPYKAKNRIQRFYFPDEGNTPEPAIDANQPSAPANDNRPAPAQTAARPAAAATGARRPWGAK